MKKFVKYLVIFAALIGIGLAYINFKNKSNQEPVFNPKIYKTITPVRKNIKQTLTLSGSVDAEKKSTLSFQTIGQLSWVGVKVGDRVKKWQAIASLDKTQLRKNLETQFNNYKTALSQFNDTQDTYKETKQRLLVTDAIQRILDRSQNSLNNAVVNYELNDLTIKLATLVSPIDGVVTDIDQLTAGTNITPANTFTIIDPNSIFFNAQIDQQDVPNVKIGDATDLVLDSYPDKTISSEIKYISFTPIAGEASTVYEIHFNLPQDNAEMNLRLGMDGDAAIILAQADNVLTVPVEAVTEDQNQKYVLVKNSQNRLVKKLVKTGIENDNDIEILEGLKDNDQIIVKKG